VTNAVSVIGSYANPAWITSLAWAKITGVPAPAVASVFGRTGVVVAAAGDYTAYQVTNAVSVAGSYADPPWITSLAWSKIAGAPPAGVSSVFTRSGAVVAAAGDYTAAQVTNAVSTANAYADPAWITALAWSKITGVPATGVATVFGRSGAVVAVAGDYTAAQVTNAVSTAGSYADPAWITSLAWAKLTGVPAPVVASVFGRTGVVVAVAGDYTAAQVTNAVSIAGSYADPAWITSLGWAKITGTPAPYTLPPATTTTLGGVKVGLGLTVDVTGLLATTSVGTQNGNVTVNGGTVGSFVRVNGTLAGTVANMPLSVNGTVMA
jgi:hypothetical protein